MSTTNVSFQDLNPASFLERTAMVYPDKPAVVYNDKTLSYAEYHDRCRRLCSLDRRFSLYDYGRLVVST